MRDFSDRYLVYSPDITEDIYNQIVKKLIDNGYYHDGALRDYKTFQSTYRVLNINRDRFILQGTPFGDSTEITLSELGLAYKAGDLVVIVKSGSNPYTMKNHVYKIRHNDPNESAFIIDLSGSMNGFSSLNNPSSYFRKATSKEIEFYNRFGSGPSIDVLDKWKDFSPGDYVLCIKHTSSYIEGNVYKTDKGDKFVIDGFSFKDTSFEKSEYSIFEPIPKEHSSKIGNEFPIEYSKISWAFDLQKDDLLVYVDPYSAVVPPNSFVTFVRINDGYISYKGNNSGSGKIQRFRKASDFEKDFFKKFGGEKIPKTILDEAILNYPDGTSISGLAVTHPLSFDHDYDIVDNNGLLIWNDGTFAEKTTALSEDSILEECKRLYPRGTLYIPAHISTFLNISTGEVTNLHDDCYGEHTGNVGLNGHDYNGIFHYEKKFAKIIDRRDVVTKVRNIKDFEKVKHLLPKFADSLIFPFYGYLNGQAYQSIIPKNHYEIDIDNFVAIYNSMRNMDGLKLEHYSIDPVTKDASYVKLSESTVFSEKPDGLEIKKIKKIEVKLPQKQKKLLDLTIKNSKK